MLKLSDRLNSIATEIKPNETMVDIGCDHGLLPYYLKKEGICPKVCMIDISQDSLNKAKQNFGDLPGEFILGDGLKPVEVGQFDKIVIAGMGGLLIAQILGQSIEKAKSCKALILQPRNNISLLRKWLFENEFEIAKEKLVKEGKYICQIIVAEPSKKTIIPPDVELEYPESYECSQELLEEYLTNQLKKEKTILGNLKKAKRKDQDAISFQKKKIDRLKCLLEGKDES